MADNLTTLQSQLDKLNAARATGMLSVEYLANGVSRKISYKTDREMNAAVQDLQRRIAALQGNTSRTVVVTTSKGLGDRDDR